MAGPLNGVRGHPQACGDLRERRGRSVGRAGGLQGGVTLEGMPLGGSWGMSSEFQGGTSGGTWAARLVEPALRHGGRWGKEAMGSQKDCKVLGWTLPTDSGGGRGLPRL